MMRKLLGISAGLAVGVLIGCLIPSQIPAAAVPFCAVGLLAACNTLFGGFAASLRRKFDTRIFLVGFFSNSLLAGGLTFAGTLLGVDFSLAAIVYFGVRIFNNLAKIQHYILQKYPNRGKIKALGDQTTGTFAGKQPSDADGRASEQVIDNGGRHDGI